MEPDIHNGDTVIVRQQDDAENDTGNQNFLLSSTTFPIIRTGLYKISSWLKYIGSYFAFKETNARLLLYFFRRLQTPSFPLIKAMTISSFSALQIGVA